MIKHEYCQGAQAFIPVRYQGNNAWLGRHRITHCPWCGKELLTPESGYMKAVTLLKDGLAPT